MKNRILSLCAVLALLVSTATSANASCGDWWNVLDRECSDTGHSYCANDCDLEE